MRETIYLQPFLNNIDLFVLNLEVHLLICNGVYKIGSTYKIKKKDVLKPETHTQQNLGLSTCVRGPPAACMSSSSG